MSTLPQDRLSSDTLVRFVRGQVPCDLLSKIGLHVRFDEGSPRISGRTTGLAIASIQDVAAGLLRLRGQPKELRAWATVILVSDSVDLTDEFETDPQADTLLAALWDISFGDAPDSWVFDLASEIYDKK